MSTALAEKVVEKKTENGFDALGLLQAWRDLKPGAMAQLRRAAEPDALRDIPDFYRLVQPFGWQEMSWKEQEALVRMVFCLSAHRHGVHHKPKEADQARGITLGQALAKGEKISERRIFQLIRADAPQDMIQLRRLLIHADPVLDWEEMAKQLTYWGKKNRQKLLEDFVLAQPPKK